MSTVDALQSAMRMKDVKGRDSASPGGAQKRSPPHASADAAKEFGHNNGTSSGWVPLASMAARL
jgi:hypothetical protein